MNDTIRDAEKVSWEDLAEMQKRSILFEGQITKPWKMAARFIQLPRIIVADKELSDGAIRLATILCTYDMPKHHITKVDKRSNKYAGQGKVFPGLSKLSDAMGRSKPMVIKYSEELVSAGYLAKRRRFGKSSLFIMKFPRITSIESLVKKYHVFSVPLTEDDFREIMPGHEQELEIFFMAVKRIKEWYRFDRGEGEDEMTHAQLEQAALEHYSEDLKAFENL